MKRDLRLQVLWKYSVVGMVMLICLLLFSGCSSGGGDDDKVGDCGVCQTDSDCKDNFWCAPFLTGPNRCVPDNIGPDDPYTCTVTN